MMPPPRFARIHWDGRPVDIEYQWVGNAGRSAPILVFLHEGLGSVSMWRDFPDRLCRAAGCPGLVYSRPGYGRSTPRSADQHWATDFMHRQAYSVLPAFLDALEIDPAHRPIRLFGHSDGASIALLYAARFPEAVAGVIAESPHIMVETLSIESIKRTRAAYLETDLRRRLARHHADPDSAFWGWNDIWLHPAFRVWSIEDEIAAIRCPLLAIQGLDDEYGTLEQIHRVARRAAQTRIVELADCGHSPHRDRAAEVIRVATGFLHEPLLDFKQVRHDNAQPTPVAPAIDD